MNARSREREHSAPEAAGLGEDAAAPAVAATIDFAAAAARTYDVVVVGAGPAGAATAVAAAREGAHVLLVDRRNFPREKPCGGCLGPRGQELARAFGSPVVTALVDEAPAIEILELATPGRRVRMPMSSAEGRGYRVVDRATFDATLVRAAVDGFRSDRRRTPTAACREARGTVDWIAAVHVHGARRGARDDALAVSLEASAGDGHAELKARVAVLATGLSGAKAQRFGLPAARVSPTARIGAARTIERDRVEAAGGFDASTLAMHATAGGYVGACRLPGGDLHLAAALAPASVRARGVDAAARAVLEATDPRLGALVADARAPWRGTPPLTRRLPRVGSGRVLTAGDASAYVEPFTGEGITWALASGELAGRLAGAEAVAERDGGARGARGARDVAAGEGLAPKYARAWRESLGPAQRRCASVARLVRSRVGMRVALALLARSSRARRAVVAPWLGPWPVASPRTGRAPAGTAGKAGKDRERSSHALPR